MSQLTPADLHTIIVDPDGAETLVKRADELGKSLKAVSYTHLTLPTSDLV